MATVKLFGSLRAHVEEYMLELSAETVGAALDKLCEDQNGLREALFDNGSLQPHVRVMVNGRDVELDQGLATAVGQDDKIAVFPPIAGGQGKTNIISREEYE